MASIHGKMPSFTEPGSPMADMIQALVLGRKIRCSSATAHGLGMRIYGDQMGKIDSTYGKSP